MRKSVSGPVAVAFVLGYCLLSTGGRPRPLASAEPAPQGPAGQQTGVAPTTAAGSVLENIEITPDGGVNIYTRFKGKRMRSLAISPQGSLIAGGVSRVGTPFTDEPPTIDPVEYDKAGAGGGRNWIHDFYFGR